MQCNTNILTSVFRLQLYIWFVSEQFVGNFILKVRTNLFAHKYYYCFYTVKLFQVLLSNTNDSNFAHLSSIPNTILFSIICLHTHKWLQVLLCNTNNSTVICLHTVKWSSSSIWPIDGTLTCTTTLGQSGLGSNCNERVLHICQSSRTGASPSDSLVSYPGHEK